MHQRVPRPIPARARRIVNQAVTIAAGLQGQRGKGSDNVQALEFVLPPPRLRQAVPKHRGQQRHHLVAEKALYAPHDHPLNRTSGSKVPGRPNLLPMASQALRSVLIIEVPEAEPAVRRHRERLDVSAPLGVPAHITVLAPFMPPEAIDTAVLTQIGQLFADITRFRFQLDRTDWFGDQVLWLAPRDPAPFRALTQRVFQAFPAFPPQEGRYDDVVPHLTDRPRTPPAGPAHRRGLRPSPSAYRSRRHRHHLDDRAIRRRALGQNCHLRPQKNTANEPPAIAQDHNFVTPSEVQRTEETIGREEVHTLRP